MTREGVFILGEWPYVHVVNLGHTLNSTKSPLYFFDAQVRRNSLKDVHDALPESCARRPQYYKGENVGANGIHKPVLWPDVYYDWGEYDAHRVE